MRLLHVKNVVWIISNVLLMIVLSVMHVKMKRLKVTVGYEREEYKMIGAFV